MSVSKQSYLERVQTRLRNNPVIAWGIVLTGVIVTTATLIPSSQLILKQFGLTSDRPPLNITLTAFDPRWCENGAPLVEEGAKSRRASLAKCGPEKHIMNWGGGTESVFVETGQEVTIPERTDEDIEPILLDAVRDGNAKQIWDFLPKEAEGFQFNANITYDAPRDAPICFVKEWGVSATPVSVPKHGFRIHYPPIGGADVARTSAWVEVSRHRQFNPMVQLLHADATEDARGKSMVTYLNPGEPAFFLMTVSQSESEVTGGDEASRSPQNKEPLASELRVYARVLIAGKEYVIKSANAVYVIWDDDSTSEGYVSPNLIENLRPLAFVPRGGTPPSDLKQAMLLDTRQASSRVDRQAP